MKEENTLLELVEACPVTVVKASKEITNAEAKLERVKELRSLGFNDLADNLEKDLVSAKMKRIADYKYIRIGDEMIEAFLKRRVERYNREHKKEEKKEVQGMYETESFRSAMIDYRGRLSRALANSVDLSGLANASRLIAQRQQLQPTGAQGVYPLPRLLTRDILEIYRTHESTKMLIRNGNVISIEFRFRQLDYSTQMDLQIVGVRADTGLVSLPIIEGFIHDVYQNLMRSIDPRNQMSRQARQMQEYRQVLNQQMAAAAWDSDRSSPVRRDDLQVSNGGIKETLLCFTAKTCDYISNDPTTIGKFVWTENRLGNYKGIPPKEVIETLKEHKERQVFDYFTIAAVEGIHDPLLLGRLNGVNERFYIINWGVDVCLDDLI